VGQRRLIVDPVPQISLIDSPELIWSQASREAWLDGEPAPDPVEVFSRLLHQLNKYIDFPDGGHPEGNADATFTLSLYFVLSYAFPAFDAVPIVQLTGPAASGKTRVLECSRQVVFRPIVSSSMTASSLFRTIDQVDGTPLLDEAEALAGAGPHNPLELHQILLSGNTRGGRVTRTEGDRVKMPRSFHVYGCKCVASIRCPTGPFLSRCIIQQMQRSKSDKCRLSVSADAENWRKLRDDLHRIALAYGSEWLAMAKKPQTPDDFAARVYQLWNPLLTLAAWLERHGLAGACHRLTEHARRVQNLFVEDQFPFIDEMVLRALAHLTQDHTQRDIRCTDILDECRKAEPYAFRSVTARRISSVLHYYGIKTRQGHRKYYPKEDAIRELKLLEERYGIVLFENDSDIPF
jgi:hypothetical protein